MAVNNNVEFPRRSMIRGALGAAALGGITFLAPHQAAQAAPFNDISRSVFKKEIEWMYNAGIAEGWSNGKFRPLAHIKRDAMAAFIYRFSGSPQTKFTNAFVDVPQKLIFSHEISWMKAQGIAWGWTDGTFRPYDTMKRDAMAAFLYRLLDRRLRYSGVNIKVDSVPQFKDVSSNRVFAHEIRWMKASGISKGWSDGTYRPDSPVCRQDMAAFIYRAAQLADKAA